MKNIIIVMTKSVIYISMIACVLLWSCNNDDAPFDPSIRAQPLTITSIEPGGALEGSTITIIGTNFNPTPTKNLVTFNGLTGPITATVTASSSNSITTIVPSGAVTGKVAVTTNSEETSGTDFTVTYQPPTITDISETSAVEGVEIIISGTNFSPLPSENIVKINGSDIPVDEATSTSIKFVIPAGTPVGTNPIIVSVQGVDVSGPDFTLLNAITLVIPIDEGPGDVEEAADGRMRVDDTDIEIAEWNTAATPDYGEQNCGFRFNDVQIPAGVVISSARIQFTVDGTGSDPAEMTISGENVGNAVAYDEVTPANSVSGRVLTTASVIWNIEPWLSGGDKLAAQRTADLKTIIQEIVDRGDWASGNSLNFIMKPSGVSTGLTSGDTSVGREAETFESGFAPELIVTYLD